MSRPTQAHNRVPKHLRTGGTVRAETAEAFAAYLERYGQSLSEINTAVLDEATALALSSIVEGSALSGAPGQPVDTAELRDSWTAVAEGPATRLIKSDAVHAIAVEYNWGGVQYQNHGPHSRALTVHAFPRILDHAVNTVVGP